MCSCLGNVDYVLIHFSFLNRFLLNLCFTISVISNSPASRQCCTGLWHICCDAPWPEETPRQSECVCRRGLFPFLLFYFLFIVHTSQPCTHRPRILAVLQHPGAQAGLLLLQWCGCTRRCEKYTHSTLNKLLYATCIFHTAAQHPTTDRQCQQLVMELSPARSSFQKL